VSGIAILISTYNGAKKLPETLTALSKLDRSGISEVTLTVVDNASTDGTSTVVRSLWDSLGEPFPLVLLQEVTPGKLNAQEAGLKSITQPFVVICDDDNALFPDYLQVGLRSLTENPQIGVLGGRGIAVSDVPLPDWFEEYAYFFACAPQAPSTGEVRPTRNVVYGAGMWVRMEGYRRAKELGFKFILASRTGKSLSTGGEDSELCWALRYQGYEIWYVDEMRFHHHVPAERLTEDYRLRLLNGMQSNGPLGKVYLRVASGEIAQPVRHFWLKELLYTIKDGILLPVSDEVDKPRDLRRMLRNIRYLVSERSRYDAAVNQVLAYKSQW
jgi:glycosyltransferase involved in cell wall biosynthesis